MNKGKNIFFIVLGTGVIILLIIYFLLKADTYNWQYAHRYLNNEPYGHEIIDKIFEDKIKATIVEENYLSYIDSTAKNQKLVFIGERFALNQKEVEKTLEWVENGNELLLINDDIPFQLMKNLAYGIDSIQKIEAELKKYDSIIEYLEDELTNDDFDEAPVDQYSDESEGILNDSIKWYTDEYKELTNKFKNLWGIEKSDSLSIIQVTTSQPTHSVSLYYQVRQDTLSLRSGLQYYDSYLLKDYFPEVTFNSFVEEGKVVDFSVNYGNGKIRINSLPISFTNFHMTRPEVWKYNQWVLGDKLEVVLYDKGLHFTYGQPDFRNSKLDKSPLFFILSIPSFKWAWYILIGSVVIYFLFKLKREQAEIPVLRPNPNTSLEFAKAIGILRKNEADLFSLADEMYYQWETTLRNHFRTVDLDETLKGTGFLVKYPEAKESVRIINNYKAKLIKDKSLEPYEIRMIYNLINGLLNKIK